MSIVFTSTWMVSFTSVPRMKAQSSKIYSYREIFKKSFLWFSTILMKWSILLNQRRFFIFSWTDLVLVLNRINSVLVVFRVLNHGRIWMILSEIVVSFLKVNQWRITLSPQVLNSCMTWTNNSNSTSVRNSNKIHVGLISKYSSVALMFQAKENTKSSISCTSTLLLMIMILLPLIAFMVLMQISLCWAYLPTLSTSPF